MRVEAFAAALLALAACAAGEEPKSALASAPPEAPRTIAFDRVQLSAEFTCEGATFGDFDRDGHNDIAAGPWWYRGPDFKERYELMEPVIADPAHYSDLFFAWTDDFDGDGWLDLLVVTFPGKAAFWLRNPLAVKERPPPRWERFDVAPSIDNESPWFVNLVGDARRELVFMQKGRFTWAERDPSDPRAPWKLHPFSDNYKLGPFVHGLGVGDLNGDGRADVVWKNGWYEQPASLDGDPQWPFHEYSFSAKHGGAQMFVDDVDADGDADVITSLAAHEYGLSWFEQVRKDGALTFVEHRYMDDEPSDNAESVCFAELHALDLADIDGDGDRDVVTGKRWWSHGAKGDPQPNSQPVVYWFELVRDASGARYVAHLADDQSGVGTQVVAGDVDGDGLADVVIGNKRGAFVLLQRRWTDIERYAAMGRAPTLDFESGDLRGWTATGDAFALQPMRGDTVAARGREPSLHAGEHWIGGYEKLGDGPTGTLTSNPIRIEQPFASFLVGGGASDKTRVEFVLAENGEVIFKSSAANFESLQRVVADLTAWRFRPMRIRLVDEEGGGWGHLNFDDFRFHAEKPVFEVPQGVPPILALDEVKNAGLAPADAAKAMTVPPGFHVDLIAAEPDVHQPIALAIDDKGRLWVAEAFEYPQRAEGDRGRDDILVFEDADHDGTFEKRTVFASGLNLVSGLEVGFGGAWVGAAPYLMFIPDRNGDLVPDGEPQILLDGWAWQDTHETLNAFTWGPDGWLYGCHGVFTHSKVGKPGTPDEQRIPLNAAVWRYHPTRHEFEIFAEGTSNPWGVDFDENGQAFITACVIPHLYHMVQGGRFERQSGSHFNKYTFDDIKTIADHRHYVGDSPHGGNLRSNSAGGGHAHCGLMIYNGTQWPEEFRGGLYFENIHGNRVNHDVVVREGSGFVGKHADDLLVANDKWFRGISFKQGPDGSMYFIDWYDKQACHWTEPGIWDRTNGRVYRLKYDRVPPVQSAWVTTTDGCEHVTLQEPGHPQTEGLAVLSSRALAGMAVNGCEWHSRHARRILQERGRDFDAELAIGSEPQSKSRRNRWRALLAYHAMNSAAQSFLRDGMLDDDEYVRAWSIQLALEDKQTEPETLALMEQLAATDPSPVVRLYLASALQRMTLEQRWNIAANLSRHSEDAFDHNLPLMYWYAIEPLVAADPHRALTTFTNSPIEKLARFVVRRAAAEPKLHGPLVSYMKDQVSGKLEWQIEEVAKALKDQRGLKMPLDWPKVRASLDSFTDRKVHQFCHDVGLAFGDTTSLPGLRFILADTASDPAVRIGALDDLVRAKDVELASLVRKILSEPALRGAAIRALASYDDAQAAQSVLASYAELTVEEKRDALNTLSSRASYAQHLVDAIEASRVPRTDLGAFVVRKIEGLNDAALTERVQKSWGRVRETAADKTARIAALKGALTEDVLSKADRARGREVFSRTCQQCHTLFGTGGSVGPDLTGSNRADLDYLLSNAVDPNAVVGKDYLATMVWTNDGRLITGILRSETESSITLQTENERLVLGLDEIENRRLSDLSTMPEGLLDALREDEIRDLVAYLRGASQANLLATRANLGRFFDGRSLAGWRGAECWSVEEGEIVGATEGLAKNEFLVSELELADFRLKFEVKLVGDAGNSGVQFRSHPLESGEVRGFQADIGPGWWGKLYEEEGRGLLWPKSGEEHVHKGEWNTYEIEARGARVVTRLNGQTCVELEDEQGARRGIVALQLHSGGPTEVRFRGFELEILE